MDELTLDNQKYLSSKRAAQVTGYAKDYVGQLCREGRVKARLVGRNWYVLESSILEHRFGAEESSAEPEGAQEEENKPVSTWNPPVYTPEMAPMVPSIAPKPSPAPAVATDSTRALADMRSAWQEWFEQQEKSEVLLPDASEMLLEEAHPENAPEQEAAEEAESEQQSGSAGENVPVHIERIRAQEEEETTAAVPAPSELYHEPIAVTRRYVDVAPQAAIHASKRRTKKLRRRDHRSTERPKSNAILRAGLLSIAGLAIAVTVIGSGVADGFIQHGGYFTKVTDIIGGVHTFKAR